MMIRLMLLLSWLMARFSLIEKKDPDPSAPPPDDRPFPQDGALTDATPPESLCPRLNGQILDAGGARYRMTCGSATGCPLDDGTAFFGGAADQQRTLDGCLEACAATPGCNSINWLDTDCKLPKSIPSSRLWNRANDPRSQQQSSPIARPGVSSGSATRLLPSPATISRGTSCN